MTLKMALMGKNSSWSQNQKVKVIYSVTIVEGYLLNSSSLFFLFVQLVCQTMIFVHKNENYTLDLYCSITCMQSMTLHKEKDLIVVLFFLLLVLQYKHYLLQILEPNSLLDF